MHLKFMLDLMDGYSEAYHLIFEITIYSGCNIFG